MAKSKERAEAYRRGYWVGLTNQAVSNPYKYASGEFWEWQEGRKDGIEKRLENRRKNDSAD